MKQWKCMNRLSAALALVSFAGAAPAAVINASSCSSSAVQSALNSAQAGDTVQIPAGTCNWTTSVTRSVPANVQIIGAGTSATGGGNQTVIVDNIASGSPLLRLEIPSTGVVRISGITFRSGSGTVKDGGTVTLYGPGFVQLDHLTLDATSSANYKILNIGTGVFGVLHSSILNLTGTNAIYIYNGRQGSGDWMANYEWSLPSGLGTADAFFIEDNIINGRTGGSTYDTRVFDGFTGAKVVVRFNSVVSAVLGETHATGHAPDDRGLRTQEIYGNSVTSPLAKAPNFAMVDVGSGTGVIWGNSASNVYKNMFVLKTTRANNGTYSQTATPNGWGYCGTQFNGKGSMWDGGTVLGTNTTLGYPCLDQPGRGQGDLIRGGVPNKVNSRTGTIYWPNQALEPLYFWNNTGNIVSGWGGNYWTDQSAGRVVANRDYYPAASSIQTAPTNPFNGTANTGWGTLANRPATCTTGVGYWATDQGSWNISTSNPYGVQQNGADGVLYKCTSTNTWTVSYTPYTYPHPLRTGGGGAPVQLSPPSNLRIAP